jgi:hypothetical protein
MNVNELIEAYVADVAVRLSRRQRNDVAFELRALLGEELQAKAEASGGAVDVALATEMLRDFGHPEQVAARYRSRPEITIIDPADGYGFLRATVIGLVIIWVAGLVKELQQPLDSGPDLVLALSRWWLGTVLASFWWPGVVVTWYAIAAWVRLRWPSHSVWQPRTSEHINGGRASLVMGVLGILCGLGVLIEPRGLLELFWGSQLAPAAYDALTYTESFRQQQGPLLFALLLLNIPIMIGGVASGRWTTSLRRLALVLEVAVCGVMIWTVLDGPIFIVAVSDRFAKMSMVLIVLSIVVFRGVQLYRRVSPAPDRQVPVRAGRGMPAQP